MGGNIDANSLIRSYKFNEERRNTRSQKKNSNFLHIEKKYKDLRPSLNNHTKVVFVGFNPGVQSSIQQHHYAHFTNLFWKLFNDSKIFIKVNFRGDFEETLRKDNFLSSLITPVKKGNYVSHFKPEHDFALADYYIGFTDLVLRCTKSAQELPLSEKIANVPRLIEEFKYTGVKFIVIVGKGIWEIIIAYLSKELGIKVKLSKDNFTWGQQTTGKDETYNSSLQLLHNLIGTQCKVYVFPNTSGLVASMSYADKLNLWVSLGNDIQNSN